ADVSTGPAAERLYAVDLASHFGSGGVQQTFSTVPGRTYHVLFQMGTSMQGGRNGRATLHASAPGHEEDFSISPRTPQLSWELKDFDFTADSDHSTLAFSTTADPAVSYVNLDDVRVTDCPGPCLQLRCPDLVVDCTNAFGTIVHFPDVT